MGLPLNEQVYLLSQASCQGHCDASGECNYAETDKCVADENVRREPQLQGIEPDSPNGWIGNLIYKRVNLSVHFVFLPRVFSAR